MLLIKNQRKEAMISKKLYINNLEANKILEPKASSVDRIKIAILGDPRVGKTSLVKKYCYDQDPSPNYEPTVVLSFERKLIKQKIRNISVSFY